LVDQFTTALDAGLSLLPLFVIRESADGAETRANGLGQKIRDFHQQMSSRLSKFADV